MKCVRVKLYQSGEFTGCEDLFVGDSHVKALDQFHKEFPCADRPDCTCSAETIDSDDPKWQEYIQLKLEGR